MINGIIFLACVAPVKLFNVYSSLGVLLEELLLLNQCFDSLAVLSGQESVPCALFTRCDFSFWLLQAEFICVRPEVWIVVFKQRLVCGKVAAEGHGPNFLGPWQRDHVLQLERFFKGPPKNLLSASRLRIFSESISLTTFFEFVCLSLGFGALYVFPNTFSTRGCQSVSPGSSLLCSLLDIHFGSCVLCKTIKMTFSMTFSM